MATGKTWSKEEVAAAVAAAAENVEILRKAWIAEGRLPPLLWGEREEMEQFAERHGVNSLELMEAFRLIVERHEQWIQQNFRSN